MKRLLLLLMAAPLGVWAQPESLKPIEHESWPTYVPGQYGPRHSIASAYYYDGIEVRRVTELGKYILASQDPDAIGEYRKFIRARHAGSGMMAAGGVLTVVGLFLGPTRKSEPRSVVPGNLTYYNGLYYGNGQVYGGNPYANRPSSDVREANPVSFGLIFGGLMLATAGYFVQTPGLHFRRSVQYYNRALRNRVSIRLEPYREATNTGVALVARF
ncbi:hypothetical protein [Larkinella soli]|uniref:hypothetical protein n=1 Tax=Larkinella soli TaxID=1770527 RepID=UPI000FFC089C|nr:hypothetical protein [Larkinella soli]